MITCKHAQLRIDVHGGSKHINAKVGCFPAHNGDNQKWSIERPFKESLEFKITSVQNIQNNGRKKMLVLGNTGDVQHSEWLLSKPSKHFSGFLGT